MPAYFNGKKVAGVQFSGSKIYGRSAPSVPLIKSIKLIISNGNANPSTGTLGDGEVNSDTALQLSNNSITTYSDLKSMIVNDFLASDGSIVSPTKLFNLISSSGMDKIWWCWAGGFQTRDKLDANGKLISGASLSIGRASLTEAMLTSANKTGAYVSGSNYFNGTLNKAGNTVDLTLVYSIDKSADLIASAGKSYRELFG